MPPADEEGGRHADMEPTSRARPGRWLVFLASCVVVFILASALIHLGSERSGTARQAARAPAVASAGSAVAPGAGGSATPDVELVSCGTSALGYAAARLVVTNRGAAARSYLVSVAFRSPADGEKISSATTAVERVPPGRRSAVVTANSIDMVNRPFVCRVSDARAYVPDAP